MCVRNALKKDEVQSELAFVQLREEEGKRVCVQWLVWADAANDDAEECEECRECRGRG
jgi:hypothetical protein